MENDFTIIQASWLTKRKRNYEYDVSLVYRYFKRFFVFLQEQKLVTRQLISEEEHITDDSKLVRSDLTDEGFAFFKVAHDRWADNIMDRGKSPDDVKYLEKKLKEIREK
jgi:hypothetical protein